MAWEESQPSDVAEIGRCGGVLMLVLRRLLAGSLLIPKDR